MTSRTCSFATTLMFDQLNNHEEMLIARLAEHPFFLQLERLDWQDLLGVLIQRRFLSLSIVNVYEFVIDGLDSLLMKETVRSILGEEFPRSSTGRPLLSHRELLFQDLINLGATRDQILRTPESAATARVVSSSMRELHACLYVKHPQLALLSFLRFWGEVLVGEEYSLLWTRLSERLSSSTSKPNHFKSQFYYYHKEHDRRRFAFGKEELVGGLTHSDELARHIKALVADHDSLTLAMCIEENATNLKLDFYNQFA
jgi:hypothetical protein